MSSKPKKIITFFVCVLAPLLVGFLSSLVSGDIRGSYEQMGKPPLSPPGWLFGVVWPVLYILMGIALFLVLQKAAGSQRTAPLVLFCAQLLVNFSWSIIFFRANSLWLALAVIILLDILVIACIIVFSKHSKPAALLLLPYILWILFATYLNAAFAIFN